MSESEPLLDRRRLLKRLSTTALVLGAHGSAGWALAQSGSDSTTPARRSKVVEPRILALTLLTEAPLEEMRAFYSETLGLPVVTENDGAIVVSAGSTEITFVEAPTGTVAPFYHFAFNIPENKILAARSWQLERTPLFITPENLRDPGYPDDVRHFRSWNAHSVFFWDPAGNVVEYIARHELANDSDGPFGPHDILYASEIAFVVDQVPEAASRLQDALELTQYGSGGEPFWAMGDEHGLLLLFKRGRRMGDKLRDRPAPAAVFQTRAEIRGTRDRVYTFSHYPYRITARGQGRGA